jgi:putative copper resistance protein D
MTGALPPPIGPWTLLTRWSLSPLPVVGCIAAVTWYLSNARRVASAGHPVPIRRRIAFVSGVGVVMVALASSIDAYADVSFSVHMVQHVLLSFVAPPLLALGAPVALALRSASPSGRARLSAVLRSRVVRALTRPVIGFVAFAGLPFVLHFSPIYDLALRDTWVHALEHLALLGAGVVYWWPLVGSDPVPHRPSHIARVVSLLLLLPVESFLSLAIYSADAPLYPTYANLPAPFGPNALADQQGAAALMWVVGAAVTISIALAAAAAWRRDDEARQRRLERLEDERAASAG